MRKLGLIGGTGPESTIPYYREIVYGVRERTGSFPPLSIESVDVFRVLDFCGRKDYGGLLAYLLRAVESLAAAGSECAALTGNTPHIVFPELQARSPIPLVSMPEAACLEAERLGMKRLLLLGTRFTMEEDFFKRPFWDRGMEILIPDPAEQLWIDHKISDELELGAVRPETQSAMDRVLRQWKDHGADACILGCTELPMLYRNRPAPLPLLDTMAAHIRTLIDWITEND